MRGVETLMELLPKLPSGDYPFLDERPPLTLMAFGLAPEQLRTLIIRQAELSGMAVIRDEPVELRLVDDSAVDATFVVFWPSDHDHMYVLMPTRFVAGRA